MGSHWVLVCHGLATLLVVVSFLCGQWPIFHNTPIQRLHFFLTFGAYDYFLRCIGYVFGNKGTAFIYSVEHACCDRPNPVLQIIYLAIVGGVYYFVVKSSFSYIPGYYLTEVHMNSNCRECFRNNCIGERNTRYFMAFLLWHFLLCIYGTIALGLVLAGRLKELRIVYILTVYYGVDDSFHSLAPHVVQWLLGSYNTQILLMVFLAIVSLLLAGFFGYHANLCITNTTTNETFKWQDYISWQMKVNEAKASAEALKASISGMSSEPKPAETKWRAFFRRSPLQNSEAAVKRNVYDKGFLHNINEIIFPHSTRRWFSQSKSKSS